MSFAAPSARRGLGLHPLEREGAPIARRAAAIDLELARAGLALADLADAPRGRRATSRAERLELGALLEDCAASWRRLGGVRGVPVVVVPTARPLPLTGDRLRLAQALANLVSNAVEHERGASSSALAPPPGRQAERRSGSR